MRTYECEGVLKELLDDGEVDKVGLEHIQEVIQDRYDTDHVDRLPNDTSVIRCEHQREI